MMKASKLIGLLVAAFLLAPLPARAQLYLPADTLLIRFRLDSIRIDMGFADNARAWDTFAHQFSEHFSSYSPRDLRLDIYSGASPEGTPAHNRWLGENRGQAIRRLVRQQLPGRIGSIVIHNEAARWDAFYEAVADSHEPWRDEVLAILDQPASANEDRWDHREYQLRALHGGSVWPELLEKYLSPLRSGSTAILSWVPVHDTLVVMQQPPIIPATPVPGGPGCVCPAGTCPGSCVCPASCVCPGCGHGRAPDAANNKKGTPAREASSARPAPLRYPVWILRTNLPFLALGTPNVQAEWSVGHRDRWSINVEGAWSWWTWNFNDYANQIIYSSVELRYWLGRRWRHHTLAGWHIGLGTGGGYGDLEWNGHGYQAEVYSGFINVGWQHRFGRRRQWAFDAGAGVGYAYVTWRRYTGSRLFPVGHEEEHSDHLMWRETGSTHWFGPVHANISLGYCFPQPRARWRRLQAMERYAERNDYLFFRDSLKACERYSADSLRIARREAVLDSLEAPATSRDSLRLEHRRWRLELDRQRSLDNLEYRLKKAASKYKTRKY